jgi:hypothetical protein
LTPKTVTYPPTQFIRGVVVPDSREIFDIPGDPTYGASVLSSLQEFIIIKVKIDAINILI